MNRAIGIAAIVIVGISLTAFPFGISAGVKAYTIDLAASFSKVGPAVTAAGTALGLSPAQINDVVTQVTAAIPTATVVPVPLIGGTIELGVPLLVIDSVSISGGIMTDGIVRGIASAVGAPIPRPVVHETFTTDTGPGTLTVDPSFFTYAITIAAGKRLDLFLAAVDASIGATWVAGDISPGIAVEAPPPHAGQVTAAIAALHPDGLLWSGFGVTAGIGVELGLPFLRMRAEGGLFMPVYTSSGWWGVKLGEITAGLGITVRF